MLNLKCPVANWLRARTNLDLAVRSRSARHGPGMRQQVDDAKTLHNDAQISLAQADQAG